MKSLLLTAFMAASFILHPSSFDSGSAAAADNKFILATGATLVPGTTYYYPDGLASKDSAWVPLGPSISNTPSYFSLYAQVDSVLGYDAPCSLRVEAVYGLRGTVTGDGVRIDTTQFLGYPSTTVVFNEPFGPAPADSAQLISSALYLHDEHRWKITVSDTCKLSLVEKVGKP